MKRTLVSAMMPTRLALLVGLLFLSGPAGVYPDLQVALASAAQQPYPGPDPYPIPGKIEAEDYDTGGEGVAYHDTTLGNEGREYRSDDVDIQSTEDMDGGYNQYLKEERKR